MKKTRLLVATLFLALATGLQAQSDADVQTAIEEAKAAYKKADSVKGAWVNTPKLIKKAEAAAAKGDNAKALEMATAAKEEADLGYAQAVQEKENWAPPPYIR